MTKYEELKKICEETNTRLSGIQHLLKYYTDSLGWTINQALDHVIGLFKNGTIEQIKIIGKDGEEL